MLAKVSFCCSISHKRNLFIVFRRLKLTCWIYIFIYGFPVFIIFQPFKYDIATDWNCKKFCNDDIKHLSIKVEDNHPFSFYPKFYENKKKTNFKLWRNILWLLSAKDEIIIHQSACTLKMSKIVCFLFCFYNEDFLEWVLTCARKNVAFSKKKSSFVSNFSVLKVIDKNLKSTFFD